MWNKNSAQEINTCTEIKQNKTTHREYLLLNQMLSHSLKHSEASP